MRARLLGGSLLLLAVGLTARAGETPPPHEAILQQMIAQLDAISATLMKIADADTAKAAHADLRKAAATWNEARKKADALPPPERKEKDRLARAYRPKLEASLKKLFGQVTRVQVVPGGRDALQEIRSVLTKAKR